MDQCPKDIILAVLEATHGAELLCAIYSYLAQCPNHGPTSPPSQGCAFLARGPFSLPACLPAVRHCHAVPGGAGLIMHAPCVSIPVGLYQACSLQFVFGIAQGPIRGPGPLPGRGRDLQNTPWLICPVEEAFSTRSWPCVAWGRRGGAATHWNNSVVP